MGHSRQDKADSHDRVVRVAAARLRESGLDGPGVADLMKEAGLTHGGFYRHFGSRDDLVAEAVEYMKDQFERRLTEVADGGLGELFDGYLSGAHRDAPATGCAVVAIGGDIARADDRARASYTRQVRLYLDLIGGLLEEENASGARARAIVTLSTMVGAMLLARAVNDDGLSWRCSTPPSNTSPARYRGSHDDRHDRGRRRRSRAHQPTGRRSGVHCGLAGPGRAQFPD
jgi:TetR/AcrR family transcriptional regulator, transcriptional repressor for nem operon